MYEHTENQPPKRHKRLRLLLTALYFGKILVGRWEMQNQRQKINAVGGGDGQNLSDNQEFL